VIFVTVGTDGPFDRLIQAVDRWAGESGRRDVFAQIGRSTLQPRHIQYVQFLEPPEFAERFRSAAVVVSHAGMGTILTALHQRKPVLVMPRRATLGEQRNEHQLATAHHLSEQGKITVAIDEDALRAQLDRIDDFAATGAAVGPYAQPELIAAIKGFIHRTTDDGSPVVGAHQAAKPS
jgi:exopolysaccharide biosynthesis glucuronosyltransferase PssE